MLSRIKIIRELAPGPLLNSTCAIVTFFIGLAAYLTAWGLHTRLADATAALDERVALLQDAAALRAASQQLHNDVTAAQSHIQTMQARLPSSPDETQFLQELSALAANCQVDLGDFRPGSELDHSSYKEIDLRIRARGTYGRLCEFLDAVSKLPRYVRIAQLSIAAPAANGGNCDVDLQLFLAFGFRTDTSSAAIQP